MYDVWCMVYDVWQGSGDRLSYPLFVDPNWFASLEPIEKHLIPAPAASASDDLGVYERWDNIGTRIYVCVFDVWCMMYDVWRMMYDVWRVM